MVLIHLCNMSCHLIHTKMLKLHSICLLVFGCAIIKLCAKFCDCKELSFYLGLFLMRCMNLF